MEGKRDRFMRALAALGAMRCVTCGGVMTGQADSLRCEKGHTFNINRKGFVNLLSRQAVGCYDAGLFEARHRVLQAGFYEPVIQAIHTMLPDSVSTILDAGCGEGWYLDRLLTLRPGCCGVGIDISRDAILRATDHASPALWCVADLRRLPLMDGSMDAVLDVLTPAGYSEFSRVLSPRGVLVKVYPASDYLCQLRAAAGMPDYEDGRVEAFLREKCSVIGHQRVTAVQPVTPDQWADFVRMTPLLQSLSPEEKERIAAHPEKEITIDLNITACRPAL